MRELLQLPDDRCLCSMSFERQNGTVGIGKSTGFASRTHASRKLFGHHRMLIPKAHSNTYITRLHFFKLPCVSVCLRSTNARINMRRVALQCIVFSVHPSAWPITFPKTHTQSQSFRIKIRKQLAATKYEPCHILEESAACFARRCLLGDDDDNDNLFVSCPINSITFANRV